MHYCKDSYRTVVSALAPHWHHPNTIIITFKLFEFSDYHQERIWGSFQLCFKIPIAGADLAIWGTEFLHASWFIMPPVSTAEQKGERPVYHSSDIRT